MSHIAPNEIKKAKHILGSNKICSSCGIYPFGSNQQEEEKNGDQTDKSYIPLSYQDKQQYRDKRIRDLSV